jgi:cell wall-associated NlpC family hydrolase
MRVEDDRKVDIPRIRRTYASGDSPYKNITPPGLNRDAFLLEVVSYLGVPYRYGGNSKAGIDCSGFASAVYAAATEKRIPRSTREMFGVGTVIAKDDLEFGDLVFFNTTGRRPSHVGIYLEDDLFAHASVRGVTISSLESTYYRKRYLGARRIVE